MIYLREEQKTSQPSTSESEFLAVHVACLLFAAARCHNYNVIVLRSSWLEVSYSITRSTIIFNGKKLTGREEVHIAV